ncbi:peroxisomal membrane protein 4 [Capsaspora owczarzaki ATCC 30864]|nr:peroxisomal membrane protein 4 [Capsaspora owczarzaki ATCC 30864]|eukprot:XP_004349317.2 peroxisomal membrane protein 4 [Capsaspora owczarzaki ATCC 30864]
MIRNGKKSARLSLCFTPASDPARIKQMSLSTLASVKATLDVLLASANSTPAVADLLAIVKGFRNGLVYGAKIRAPHAFVMTFLFGRGSLKNKATAIFKATYTHSRNLSTFVLIYKSLLAVLKRLQGVRHTTHPFIAAFIGGWYVFGENNNINSQINMYLLSRIIFGLAKLAVEKGYIPKPQNDPFPLFAALVWGIVLWLFEQEKHTLQPSLQASMTYLYHDSNHWTNLKNFLWHNK